MSSEEEVHRGLGAGPNKKAKMNNGSSAPSSFAARMMAKMGYKEGEGLGAQGRGRLAPIETQTRPQGAGLGAVKEKTKQAKEEEKREAAFRGEVLEDSSEEERKRRRKEKERRKALGGNSGARAKPKVKYRTAAKIEAESEGLQVPNVLKNIIDLTGKETNLLVASGVSHSGTFMIPGETEAQKLAKRARRDLEALADEWATVQERKKYLDLESAQLIGEIDAHQEELQSAREIISSIHQLQLLSIGNATSADSWEAVTKKLESMEIDFKEEVSQQVLQDVAVAAVYPLFRQSMAEWQPLDDPAFLVPHLSRLEHVLGINMVEEENSLALRNGDHSINRNRKSTTPYETLIHTLWLPPVRSAITNAWNVYDSAPLITLLEAWRPLLPTFIFSNVIDQLIVHRLSAALSQWEPPRSEKRHKKTPAPTPDIWLLPWLDFPYLSAHHLSASISDSLLSALKRKYRSVLQRLPLTQSPQPWFIALTDRLGVLAPPLLIRHLLGRLSDHLNANLIIDPSDQDMTPFTDLLAFSSLFAASTTAELLTTAFFPKWHATLHTWLASPLRKETEIGEWYLWWTKKIPPAISAVGIVKSEWAKALATMNKATNPHDFTDDLLPPDNSAFLHGAHTKASSPAPHETAPAPAPASTKSTALLPETTFRDVVEEWCQEEGLLMMPLREAHATTGAPLWRITGSTNGRGGALVYVKGDVLWARGQKDRELWEPVGLDAALVKRAGG